MADKLKPPKGYKTWLDYAVATVDVHRLELEAITDDDDAALMAVPSRDEMRAAARAELDELRKERVLEG